MICMTASKHPEIGSCLDRVSTQADHYCQKTGYSYWPGLTPLFTSAQGEDQTLRKSRELR